MGGDKTTKTRSSSKRLDFESLWLGCVAYEEKTTVGDHRGKVGQIGEVVKMMVCVILRFLTSHLNCSKVVKTMWWRRHKEKDCCLQRYRVPSKIGCIMPRA